jgi:hypothetical protein
MTKHYSNLFPTLTCPVYRWTALYDFCMYSKSWKQYAVLTLKKPCFLLRQCAACVQFVWGWGGIDLSVRMFWEIIMTARLAALVHKKRLCFFFPSFFLIFFALPLLHFEKLNGQLSVTLNKMEMSHCHCSIFFQFLFFTVFKQHVEGKAFTFFLMSLPSSGPGR